MPGLEVVSDALIDAAVGVTDATADLRMVPVAALDPGADAVGHPDLADALAQFCSRWQTGVAQLVDDADEFAARLRAAASDYLGVDVLVAAQLRADGS